MKLTSSSRWAQDHTQNSSVNFSSSNPAPSLVLPRFVWSFRVLFFLPNVEDARCCLVAGQNRSFTVRYRSASCRWRRTVFVLNSWLLHIRCEVAYSSFLAETRGKADQIKTNEKAEMPDPLFSLSFHGLFLFPLTPCNSLSLLLMVSCFVPPAHAKRGGRRARGHAHSPFVPPSLRCCWLLRSQRRPIFANMSYTNVTLDRKTSVSLLKWRFIHHLKAECIRFPLIYGFLGYNNTWLRYNKAIWKCRIWGCKEKSKYRESGSKA